MEMWLVKARHAVLWFVSIASTCSACESLAGMQDQADYDAVVLGNCVRNELLAGRSWVLSVNDYRSHRSICRSLGYHANESEWCYDVSASGARMVIEGRVRAANTRVITSWESLSGANPNQAQRVVDAFRSVRSMIESRCAGRPAAAVRRRLVGDMCDLSTITNAHSPHASCVSALGRARP